MVYYLQTRLKVLTGHLELTYGPLNYKIQFEETFEKSSCLTEMCLLTHTSKTGKETASKIELKSK